MPATYDVTFWNVENLFDVDGSAAREAWLQKRLSKELRGWDKAVLNIKLVQLAKIIRRMGSYNGPDILGVCEVENQFVLEKLVDELGIPNRNYATAHADTSDGRGIDVAFIYDSDIFEKEKQFSQTILKRNATRDLFQVTLIHKETGAELILVGNHWPSRRGGQYDSEPYRMMAGETLAYWHDRINNLKGKDCAVIAMGDFNDEPFDRSLTNYALSSYQKEKVLRARNPLLFNLMWPLMGKRLGSHYFGGVAGMLDQILVSKGLLNGGNIFSVVEGSIEVLRFDEMVSGGTYPEPIRHGRPSSGYNPQGYSDHFPVSVKLVIN